MGLRAKITPAFYCRALFSFLFFYAIKFGKIDTEGGQYNF